MASQTTYDLSQVHSALGMKEGNALPSVDGGAMVQTIVVGDMSKTFGAQQFEGRGYCTAIGAATAAQEAACDLLSLSAGGVVLERIDLRCEDSFGNPASQCGFQVLPAKTPLDTVFGAVLVFNVGGVPVQSFPEGGAIIVGGTRALINLNAIGQKTFENFGWFIPSGGVFRTLGPINHNLWLTMQWRELPQAPGSK